MTSWSVCLNAEYDSQWTRTGTRDEMCHVLTENDWVRWEDLEIRMKLLLAS